MTEKKTKELKVETTPKVSNKDSIVTISKDLTYSNNGYEILMIKAGKYNASELDPIVIKLHREGVI